MIKWDLLKWRNSDTGGDIFLLLIEVERFKNIPVHMLQAVSLTVHYQRKKFSIDNNNNKSSNGTTTRKRCTLKI